MGAQSNELASISCAFCHKTHVPIFSIGNWQGTVVLSLVALDSHKADRFLQSVSGRRTIVPYNCPVTGEEGQASFPYNEELEKAIIVDWKEDV